VIREAIVHMKNEQPLMVDLGALPTSADACLVCTNVRYLNGHKPSFVDLVDSWFLIPLDMIRFVEVPQASIARAEQEGSVLALPAGPITPRPGDAGVTLDDAGFDADLLRRIREA
jgi:hypothetical protein